MNNNLDSKELCEQIAIIGMAGEFPQSPTLETFWENLLHEKELITFFSQEELEAEGIPLDIINHKNYIPAKGYLENCTYFDSSLFEYSPRESEWMDPQQRRLLTWGWAALENAGYDPNQYDGLIGAFVSASFSSYFYLNVFPRLQSFESSSSNESLAIMGNDKDFLATRLSYKLNLKGPSKTVQTACSSSLVAVHDACQSLLSYETDIAIAGGISITFPLKSGHYYLQDGIRSQDGHCRPFDANASGTLIGNGGGIIVLKRLDEALKEGDNILAIIRGSAINNDGSNKVGFTAPSVQGQMRVITAAHLNAEVDPESISYIEAHGTGTRLGDAIESSSLSEAFRFKTSKQKFCAISSVKANIGHLDAAAGIAGLIKTILMMYHKTIPRLINFAHPNPEASFVNSPFFPVLKTVEWKNDCYPLRAGISSFGMGGTNAHLILEAPPARSQAEEPRHPWHLAVFSAMTHHTLEELLKIHLNNLQHTNFTIEEITFTLQVGRKALAERIFFCSKSLGQLKDQIASWLENKELDYPVDCPPNLMTLGKKWSAGQFNDWKSLYKTKPPRRVPLPTYPFDNKLYFLPLLAIHGASLTQEKEKAVRTSFEDQFRAVWCSTLKVQESTIGDNFFLIGGDSLLGLELAEMLRATFQIELSLREIFEYSNYQALHDLVIEKMNAVLAPS